MIQLFNRNENKKDFILVDKAKPDEKLKVDLFILVARSEFFRSLASSPMLETQ